MSETKIVHETIKVASDGINMSHGFAGGIGAAIALTAEKIIGFIVGEKRIDRIEADVKLKANQTEFTQCRENEIRLTDDMKVWMSTIEKKLDHVVITTSTTAGPWSAQMPSLASRW